MTAFDCSRARTLVSFALLSSHRAWRRVSPVLLAIIGAVAAPAAHAQLGVSDSGLPGYSFPIKVPPGISGMAPNLALSFSGAGINGPVGQGWSLQGISTVTRCPGTPAIDGTIKGVKYAPNDKLCLDGQRLIQTNASGVPLTSTPAANGALNDAAGLPNDGISFTEYRTEKDTFARIRAYGSAGGASANGPAYFRVWTKSGQIYEYGAGPAADANTNALVLAQGSTVAMAWAVARTSDTLGNYIDFKYNQRDVAWGSGPTANSPQAGHEWNLVEVQYTGNSTLGQAPNNKVVFEYEDRTGVALTAQDRAEAYHQGSKNVSVQRLKAVRTYINWAGPALGVSASPGGVPIAPAAGAVEVKAIKLGYTASAVTARSLLTNITECSGANESSCLKPTQFTYSANTTGDAYQASSGFNASAGLTTLTMMDQSGSHGVINGDFFGRGRQDFIRWGDNPAENQLWKSDGNGGFTQVANGSAAGQFNITDHNLFKSDSCYYSMVVDINGDGLPDILRYSAATNLNGGGCTFSDGQADAGQTVIYLNNGDGSFNKVALSGPTLQRTVSKAITCASPCHLEGGHNGWGSGANFFFIDVDGDGKLDIVTTVLPFYATLNDTGDPCLSSVCTQVWRGNGDGSFTSIATSLANTSLYVAPTQASGLGAPRNVADFDGDGLADFVNINTQYFTKTSAFKSLGDGNFAPQAYGATCDRPLDYNGDGRADCLTTWVDPQYNSLNTAIGGGAFARAAAFNLVGVGYELAGSTDPSAPPAAVGSFIADVNGDGRSDIIRWKDDPAQNALYLSNGDGTFRTSGTFGFASVQLKKSDYSADFLVGDFTGRGNVEILRMVASPSGSNLNQLYVKQDSTPPDLLLTATSPAGIVTRLTYVPLSNPTRGFGPSGAVTYASARYTSGRVIGGASIYPKVDITAPLYVVATSEVDSGVGSGTLKTEYAYQGLRAAVNGRGMLGFTQVSQQHYGPNGQPLTVTTSYVQDHPYIGVASVTQTVKGTLGQSNPLLSRTTNAYCDMTSASAASPPAIASGGQAPTPCSTGALVQQPFLSQSLEEGWDLGGTALPTVTTTNTFNTGGDPLTIGVSTAGSVAGISQTFAKSTSNQYLPDNTACSDFQTCSWVRGRLSQSTVTSTVPNSLSQIATGYGAAANANANATTGTGPTQAAVLTPSLPFGNVVAGTSTTAVATLANDGAGPLSITVPTAGSVTGTDFSFASTTCTSSLAAGASCTITVQFAPTAGAARTGTLTVATGAGTFTSSLSGTGQQAWINGFSGTLAFGNVTVGQSATSSAVTLTNNGNVAATGFYINAPSGYAVSNSSCPTNGGTMAAGATCSFTVTFSPTAAQSYNATLTGGWTGPNSAQGAIALTGTGQWAWVNGIGGTLALGNVQVGQSATSSAVTLTNTGNVAATGFYLNAPTGYAVSNSACPANGGTMAAGASCSFTVTFSPTAAQSYNASLIGGWTGPNSGQGSISLTGTGTNPSVAKISADNFSFNTPANTGSGHNISISNNGYGPVTVNSLSYSASSGNFNAWMASSGSGNPNGGYCWPGVVLQPGWSCGAWANADTGSGTATLNTTAGNVTYTGSFTAKALSYSATTGASTPVTSGQTGTLYTLTISNATPYIYYFPRLGSTGAASSIGRFTGGNAGNFVITGTSCGANMAANSSCTVSIAATGISSIGAYSTSFQPNGTYQQGGDGTEWGWAGVPNWLVNMGTSLADVYVSATNPVNVTATGAAATLTSASTLAVPTTWYGSAAQTVTATYRNDGNAAMTLNTPSLAAPLSFTSNSCSNIAAGASCSMVVSAATNVPGISQSQSFTPSGAVTGPGATTVTWTTYTAVPRWSSTSLSFGNVAVNTTASQSITLYNDGNVAYNWAANNAIANAPAGYSFNSSACTSVAPGGSCTVTVTFTPTAIGTSYSGSGISMSAASYNTNTFSVSGTGAGSIATLTSAAAQTVPATWYGAAAQTVTATYRNDGNAAMTLATPSLAAPLSVTSNSCSNIAAGASCSMVVSAATNVAGISQSQTFTPTGATTAPAATTLTWTTYTAVPRWSTTSLSFGNVTANTSSSQSITLYNDGNVAYNWAANNGIANAPAGYTFNSSACTSVAPGGSCTVTVTFTPTAIGTSYSGSGISMSAASYNTNTFSVSGTGVGSVATLTSASSLTFATTAQGSPAPQVSWIFRNDGNASMTLSLGTLNSPFSLVGNYCSSVQPAAVCYITAQMATGTLGTFSQPSIAVSGATQGNRSDLQLAGTVASANTTLGGSPNPLAFGTVSKGLYRALAVTLTNTGTSTATGLAFSISEGSFSTGTYSWSNGTCTAGGSLAAGASCTVTVAFDASCTGGSHNGTLTTSGANFTAVATGLTAATSSSGICN